MYCGRTTRTVELEASFLLTIYDDAKQHPNMKVHGHSWVDCDQQAHSVIWAHLGSSHVPSFVITAKHSVAPGPTRDSRFCF